MRTIKDFLSKYVRSDEDKALLTRISDLVAETAARNKYSFSDFLTPAEQALVKTVGEFNRDADISFFGGYDEAIRKVAVIAPKGCPYEEKPPLSILRIKYRGATLSNRDLLGGAMALGIKRQTIGDIVDSAQPPFLVCLDRMKDYLINEFKYAARTAIELEEGEAGTVCEPDFDEISATVASLRLDAVAAECFGLSRSVAADIIRKGLVARNYIVCTELTKQIAENDIITARGFGKACVSECGGMSRKGRIFIKIRRYK